MRGDRVDATPRLLCLITTHFLFRLLEASSSKPARRSQTERDTGAPRTHHLVGPEGLLFGAQHPAVAAAARGPMVAALLQGVVWRVRTPCSSNSSSTAAADNARGCSEETALPLERHDSGKQQHSSKRRSLLSRQMRPSSLSSPQPCFLLLLLLLQLSSSSTLGVTASKAPRSQQGSASALWLPRPHALKPVQQQRQQRQQQQEQQQQRELLAAFLSGSGASGLLEQAFQRSRPVCSRSSRSSSSNSSSSSRSLWHSSSSKTKIGLRAYNGCGFVSDESSGGIDDPEDLGASVSSSSSSSNSSSSSSSSSSSVQAAVAASRQQIHQQLSTGSVKPAALLSELQQLQQQQQQPQQQPKSLGQLADWLAAARHGQLGRRLLEEKQGGDNQSDPVRVESSASQDHLTRQENKEEDPFSLETILKAAKSLRRSLSTRDEARKAFFVSHYERELAALGVLGAPQGGAPPSAEALADRLAVARAFAAARRHMGPPTAAAGRSRRQKQQQQQLLLLEARPVSPKQQRKKGALSGGRASRQGPGRRRLGSSLLGFPSVFDVFLGGGDSGGEEQREETEQQQQQTQHPLEQLLQGMFGNAGSVQILGDPSAGPDLLQQLFGGAAALGGPKGGSQRRQQRIDFLQPEQAEAKQQQQQQQQQEGSSSSGWREELETDPRVLSLFDRAKAKGSPALLEVLRRAFSDDTMRQLLLKASSQGLTAAQKKAPSAGRYLLARLHDEGLLP
ncbi:hypothetical protein Esti_003517 [Eimeria stiedai]